MINELERLKAILDTVETPIFVKDDQHRIVQVNRAFYDLFALTESDVIGKTLADHIPADEMQGFFEVDRRVLDTGVPYEREETLTLAGRAELVFFTRKSCFVDKSGKKFLVGSIHDITARKAAETALRKSEAQLQQARKLESVGLLAGGVAHDFNNMLAVIIGYTDLALAEVDPAQPLHAHLEQVSKAALRSADLTQQLLAFARKQTIQPKVLDLNAAVTSMLKMLRRLIVEGVEVAWLPGAGLWPVKLDPSQVDQIVTNLCLNARDAIAGVGKITVATENSVLGLHDCTALDGATPGEYLRLTVSDDGCGMDEEIRTHLFEPFFTTKDVGKGTGMGLATVYGIVKQNHGFIAVHSEPGQGATFTILFPRHAGGAESTQAGGAATPTPRGGETVLLVEDEPALLEMAALTLRKQGYAVLAAGSPGEAMRLAREHAGPIHLLLTDVVMPEMNGHDLARNLLALRPGLKRVFMSGYTADIVADHGVLAERLHFIQKPFLPKELAAKIREALDDK